MSIFTSIVMGLIYNCGNLVGLYGAFFLVELYKMLGLM